MSTGIHTETFSIPARDHQCQQQDRGRLKLQITQQTVCKLKDLKHSYCTPRKLLVYLFSCRLRFLVAFKINLYFITQCTKRRYTSHSSRGQNQLYKLSGLNLITKRKNKTASEMDSRKPKMTKPINIIIPVTIPRGNPVKCCGVLVTLSLSPTCNLTCKCFLSMFASRGNRS